MILFFLIKHIINNKFKEYFSFFIGTFISLTILYGYKLLISYLIKGIPLSLTDKFFIFKDLKRHTNIGAVIEIKNFNNEKLREIIRKKLFINKKFYSTLVSFFGEFFWKNCDVLNEPIIFNERVINKTFANLEDMNYFISQEKLIQINPFISPVEIYICSCKEEGVLFIKLDHSFCDGLSIICSLGFLDEGNFIEKTPTIWRKIKNSMTIDSLILDYIFALILGPFFFIFLIFFQLYIWLKECKLFDNFNDENKKLSSSINLPLNPIKKHCKDNNISINDYLTDSLLNVISKLTKRNKLILAVPIGSADFPNSPQEIKLYNKSTIIFSFIDIKSYEKMVINIKRYLYRSLLLNLFKFLDEFNPLILNEFTRGLIGTDIGVSNLPAMTKPIVVQGMKFNRLSAFTYCEKPVFNLFVLFNTYNEELSFSCCIKNKLECSDKINTLLKEQLLKYRKFV